MKKKAQHGRPDRQKEPAASQRGLRRILLAMRWYRRQLHEGVAAYCREQRWVLDSLDHSPDLKHANLWDGIILLHQGVPEFRWLLQKQIPLVTLAMDEKGRVREPSVLQDQEAIGAMGASHLLERGYQRLLFCGYRDGISQARFRGMRAVARKHGTVYRQIVMPHRTPANAGPDFARQWLARRFQEEEIPFAVLAAHDLLGVTVLDACRAAGFTTPEQVAVLGVDNEQIICECASVPLSSVDNDLFRHGYEAAKLLDCLIQNGTLPSKPILIPPRRVVTRASTDTIAARNPHLARILQHIHECLGDPAITVKEVCLRFGISRRALEALFSTARLNPPGQVIHEVRLRRACVELQETSKSVKEIAVGCGFSSSRSFCRYFRQVKGNSPEAWRRAHLK